MLKSHNNQRGDTIIEVLFAITVLAVILSSCYAIANKTITTTRQNNERTQALKYAESQMELVKSISTSTLDSNGVSWDFQKFITSIRTTPAKCLVSVKNNGSGSDIANSGTAACTKNGNFNLSLNYNTTSGQEGGYFVSRVDWESGTTVGAKNVEVIYRVYGNQNGSSASAVAAAPTPPPAPAPTLDSCSSSGNINRSGIYKSHTFSSPGATTFTTTCDLSIEYLIVGGGGAGGTGNVNEGGGGGGAGGFIEGSMFITAGTYNFTIGAGGAGFANDSGGPVNGGDTIAFGKTAYGGGGGGACWGSSSAGGSGGGGGGCGFGRAGSGATQPTSAFGGFGNAGGLGQWTGDPNPANGCNGNGGGGGGAGGPGDSGANRPGSCGGAGSIGGAGAGRTSIITGSTYAIGGNGGAGRSTHVGANGVNGGGGGGSANGQLSGSGGSGVVVVRYIYQ